MLIRQSRRRCQCQYQDQDLVQDQVIQALTVPSCLLKNHRPEIEHILSILWLALLQHQCNITTSQQWQWQQLKLPSWILAGIGGLV